MTPLRHAGRQRSTRTGRRGLVALGAALTLLPFGAGTASAQSFVDPADRCIGQPPEAQFEDRGEILGVHLPSVDCAVFRQIARGRMEDGRSFYRPAASIRRDQLASLVRNTLLAGGFTLPEPQESQYDDVESDNVHADAISQLTQIGVIKGKSPTVYDPATPVRRDQMASFLVRSAEFAYVDDELEGQVTAPPVFADVEPTNTHKAAIDAAVRLIGVAEGRSEAMYEPKAPTRRDQMASFVVRLLDVTIQPDVALERQSESGE